MQLVCIIAGWVLCVSAKIMWKILHSRWTVLLQVEWNGLQLTLCRIYGTADGQFYGKFFVVACSEIYVENTAQKLDTILAVRLECVTPKKMHKLLQSWLTVLFPFEWCVLQRILCGKYCTEWDGVIACWIACVTGNIIWKLLHSSWTVLFQVECSVLQWTLCGRYCTACWQWCCRLIGVCYSVQYVEHTSPQVDSVIAGWLKSFIVNIIRKVLHSLWSVLLQVEWNLL